MTRNDHATKASHDLPEIGAQARRLADLGIIGGVSGSLPSGRGLLVLNPRWAPASALAPQMTRAGKAGFVVTDMTDVDEFRPIESVTVPTTAFYLVEDPQRGDEMANWSPDEALPAIAGAGRTPLTLTEGIQWVIQCPAVLERNHCFMTIASRLRRPNGALDSRTPALWISNGTGRDGRARRDAPKVGWCWAGNRHTWLGFASAAGRSEVQLSASAIDSR